MKEEKKKHLNAFWNQIANSFLSAIQNEEIRSGIERYRETWNLHGHASTSDELESQIRQMFLQDAGLVDGAEIKDFGKIRREGNKVFTSYKSKNGPETECYWENPFHITDREILVPENKQRLIQILSDEEKIRKYSWVFEPRLQIIESDVVYPSSQILVSILHKTGFLRSLRMHILCRFGFEYFTHWPLFFYYILTGNSKFALKNGAFQFVPYRLFVVDAINNDNVSWLIKSYGNSNISLLETFVKRNKPNLKKLNKLLNNPNTSGRSPEELLILEESEKKKNIELALEYRYDVIKSSVGDNPIVKAILRKQAREGKVESEYQEVLEKNPRVRGGTKKAKESITSSKSRAKKLTKEISQVPLGFSPEIKKLVDEINNW